MCSLFSKLCETIHVGCQPLKQKTETLKKWKAIWKRFRERQVDEALKLESFSLYIAFPNVFSFIMQKLNATA